MNVAEIERWAKQETGQPIAEDCAPYGDGRYVLAERGHYGSAYITRHATPADASAYTLGQEYGEDWHPVALLDTVTGATLRPVDLVWEAHES